MLRRDAGFTLAELLIAMAILAVLSAIAVPIIASQSETAEQRALESDLTTVSTMLVTAKSFGYPLPASLPAGQVTDIQGVGTYTPAVTLQVVSTPDDVCVWGSTPDQSVTLSMSDVTGLQPGECTGSDTSGLEVEYPLTEFTTGSDLEVISPTVSGASGDLTFTLESGVLPPGVTLDSVTGDLTGPAESAWNFQAVQVSYGREHSCAVTSLGNIKCWGSNMYGQLGDNSTYDSPTPVDVLANPDEYEMLFSNAAQVAVGGAFTCALTTDGSLWCWGDNTIGQLGIGYAEGEGPPEAPAPYAPMFVGSGYKFVSAGYDFGCAIRADGLSDCWGNNFENQLGSQYTNSDYLPDGSPAITIPYPVRVKNIAGVADISAGYNHACAVAFGSQVWCWGSNDLDQLGLCASESNTDWIPNEYCSISLVNEPTRSFYVPRGADEISSGAFFTCALSSGRVGCWGINNFGQLGNGEIWDSSCRFLPQGCEDGASEPNLGGTGGVDQVAAGDNFVCAQKTIGQIYCWGNGSQGQLGNGSFDDNPSPQVLSAFPVSSGVRLGQFSGQSAAAISNAAGIRAWGDNMFGQLGDGGFDNSNVPVGTLGAGPTDGFPSTITIGVTDGNRSGSTTFTLTQTQPLQ